MSSRENQSLAGFPLGALEKSDRAATWAAETLWAACERDESATAVGLKLLRRLASAEGGADYAAVVALNDAAWKVVFEHGARQPLPVAWLADMLDRDQPASDAQWSATPLRPHAAGGEILVLHQAALRPALAQDVLVALAAVLARALDMVREQNRQQRQVHRLRTVLGIAAQWNQTHEMEPLLVQMAEAATQLLRSDRASIFLWDKPNHALIARPALGVAGQMLRVDDHEGIVGLVVQTGQPRRIDAGPEQTRIARRVDQQLGYTTRTILCVPLRSRRGEVLGAFEAINKLEGNFTSDDETALVELASHASIALENTQERQKLIESRKQFAAEAARGVELIGVSAAVDALRSTIRRVAPTELAVLVLGENGTGKEVISRAIHHLSARRDHPFIAVNCAAITETLLESELFGHEKGAFTDAHDSRAGKFELASGGTLFLDEIGDLSPGGQAKLLRVLEEKLVVRVGGSKSIHTDARVIAATNQDLSELVREKRFRQDLFYRLNVVSLLIPPLRDRPEDVMPLAEHFLDIFCRNARRSTPALAPAAQRRLVEHPWPGNVRELRNLMERLAYLSTGDTIGVEELTFILSPRADQPSGVPSNLPLADATDLFQTDYIQRAIRLAGGNMSQTAEHLGLHRSNLYRKLRQLGLNSEE